MSVMQSFVRLYVFFGICPPCGSVTANVRVMCYANDQQYMYLLNIPDDTTIAEAELNNMELV